MIIEVTSAMSAIKETIGLAKAINDAKTEAEIKNAVYEFQSKLITLQQECLSLADVIKSRDDTITRLNNELAESKDFTSQAEAYVLQQLDSGALIYAKEHGMGEGKFTVYACPSCYHQKQISLLQPTGEAVFNTHTSSWYHEVKCNQCKSLYQAGKSNYKPEPLQITAW